MTKLKKYNTLSDWETAKGGGDLLYPSVGLIKEDSSICYVAKPPHMFPIKAVFYDSSTGNFVKLYPDQITEINPNYTPIGVEVIPAEHDVYGTGQSGIMSLAEMDYRTPDVGSLISTHFYWGGANNETSLSNYGLFNYIGTGATLNDGVVQGVANYATLPSDQFSIVTGLDRKSGYRYNSASYYQAPSPYNADGSRNEAYYSTAYSTVNAFSDFDGVGNTKVLTDLATGQSDWKTATTITNDGYGFYYPAACCCWRFHTAGTDQGQWYLPACGEMGYVINRFSAINTTINKVKSVYSSIVAVKMDTFYSRYWSSSEFSSISACQLSAASGQVSGTSKSSSNHSSVRAFLRV